MRIKSLKFDQKLHKPYLYEEDQYVKLYQKPLSTPADEAFQKTCIENISLCV